MSEVKPGPSPAMMPARRPVPQALAAEVASTPWYGDKDKIERFYIDSFNALAETTVPAAFDTEVLFDRMLDKAGIDRLDKAFSWDRHHTRFRKQKNALLHGRFRVFDESTQVPGLLTVIPRCEDEEERKYHCEVLRGDLLNVKSAARQFVDRLNHVPYRYQIHEAAGLLALRAEMQISLPDQYETAILPFVRLDERIASSPDGSYQLHPHARTVHEVKPTEY